MGLPTFAAALRLIALAAVFLFAASHAWAGDLFTLEWSEPAPGVHVGTRPDPLRYPVVANSVIVVGADSALVFDGGGFPSQGEQVLAKLRAVTGKPLAFVVISHWHAAHCVPEGGGDRHGLHARRDAWRPAAGHRALKFG